MGDVRPLPRRQEIFVDERGVGLRVTWHPERELVVLSVWHGEVCTGSFRLPVAELPRLGGFLTAVFGDWAGDVLAARPEPRPHRNGGGPGTGTGDTGGPRAAAAGEGRPPGPDEGWPRFGPFRPPRPPGV
jgi:hypothetical protein